MNVSSARSNVSMADFQAGKNRAEQGMSKLSKALDSGDLSAAKTAFESMKPKDAPSGVPPQDVGNNPAAKAFSSLSSALEKGDIGAAKDAMSNIKTAMQNAKASGRMPGPPPDMEGKSDTTTDTLGNNLNTLA